VPAAQGDPGHIDGTPGAEVLFGALASAGNVLASWSGTTCTVYCHGASLEGGTLTTPTWTTVDNSQDRCGNCHGTPPPAPHPEGTDCGTCHPTMQPGSLSFLDPDSHINGTVEFTAVDPECDVCHGGGGVAAPPKDLAGNTDRALPGVGAHREHVGASEWHRELSCAQCHTVPVTVEDPGHMDGDNVAELRFDGLNPDASYDDATATCSNLYCHSNGSRLLGTVVWTDDLVLDCDSCHDDGSGGGPGSPGGPGGGPGGDDDGEDDALSREHTRHFQEGIACFECHGAVVDQTLGFVNPDLHINGVFDVAIPSGGAFDAAERKCTNLICHEDKSW
jgi:predicted CxxxxCH...CXXCH cytochrome family protein